MGNTSYAGGKTELECNSFIIVLHLGVWQVRCLSKPTSSGRFRPKHIKMGADFCEETIAINPAGTVNGADAATRDGVGGGDGCLCHLRHLWREFNLAL